MQTQYKEDFIKRVKTFMSDTGVSLSKIANDESVGYTRTPKLKEFIFKGEGTITIKVADKILNYIENYKG